MVTFFLPHGLRAYSLGGEKDLFFHISSISVGKMHSPSWKYATVSSANADCVRNGSLLSFTGLQQQFVSKKAPFAEELSTDSTDFSGVGFPKKVPDDPPAATPNTHIDTQVGWRIFHSRP